VLALALPLGGADDVRREMRMVMGTAAALEVRGAPHPEAALDAAFAVLGRVDDALTQYRDSELVRLNAAGIAEVSTDLQVVLRAALDVATASQGAFDPSVEPLLRAAGYYAGAPRALGDSERRDAMNRVGFTRVRLEGRRVRLPEGGGLDFGGIAKGYAADEALRALRSAGARGASVDLGNSSIALFGPADLVGVRDPTQAGAEPLAHFRLENEALATSSQSEQPGHIVDPRNGRPAEAALGVTVVAARAMEADALSTAVFVLGAEAGLRLLRSRGAEGFVLERGPGGGLHLRATPGFAARHELRARPGLRVIE